MCRCSSFVPQTACLRAGHAQNARVYQRGKGAASLLLLLLAGCATGVHPNGPVADGPQGPLASPPEPPPSAALSVPAPAPEPAAAVAAAPDAETWVPLERWCQQNGLAEPSPLPAAAQPGFALSVPEGALDLRIGSHVVTWAGLEVWLAFAPQLLNGQPCVNALDLEKTLEPLASKSGADLPKTNRSIVIDPGHGGSDVGTSSVLGGHYEKEYTLDWAQRLARLLVERGWKVWLTRDSDASLGLADRVAVAEQHRADLFVSLHFNSSAPDHEQSGLETYFLTPVGMPSNLTRGYSDERSLVCPNNAFDAQNLQLALSVHRALLGVNGHNDRGVRHARFPAVLRDQDRPAILVEGGYLSNAREAGLIAEPAYRQRLAEAVARALTGQPWAQASAPRLEQLPPAVALQAAPSR